MSTLFIWNNCTVSAKWHAFLKNCNIYAPARWSHEMSGHASLMITEDWEKPIKDLPKTKQILGDYDKLRMEHNKTKEKSPERAVAAGKLAAKGNEFETCLTDKSDLYVSFFPDDYAHSSHTTNPLKKKILDKFGSDFGVNYFRKGLVHRSFWHDLLWENYVPDHIIRIPDTASRREKMKKCWLEQKTKKGGDISYRFKYKNCSRLASRVLIAGFGDLLDLYWSGKVKARKIWTPLHVKRLAANICKKVKNAETMSWNAFVDELVKKGAIPGASQAKLKKFKRRATVRGSSGADARFSYDKGSVIKGDQNTASFLEPILGNREAQNAGHIFGLGAEFNDAAFQQAEAMGFLESDRSVSDEELLGDDIFSDSFDPTAGIFQFSSDT